MHSSADSPRVKHPVIISAPVRLQKFLDLPTLLIKSIKLLNPAFPSLQWCRVSSQSVASEQQKDQIGIFTVGTSMGVQAGQKNFSTLAEEGCEL